jgi:hypothetical protein
MKTLALFISLVLTITVVVSTVSLCAMTMKGYSSNPHLNPEGWEAQRNQARLIEFASVIVFTIDLTVRGVCSAMCHLPEESSAASPWKTFMHDYMNWIDLCAIAPFYVSFLWADAPDLRFLRVVRLARILKILEAAGYGSVGDTIASILVSSAGALLIPLYFMGLSLVVTSSVLYAVEQPQSQKCITAVAEHKDWDSSRSSPGNDGCTTEHGCACAGTLKYVTYDDSEWDSNTFESIPHTFWWCIVTFTTVGYGDMSPRTSGGHIVAAGAMALGIFFLAMPLAIIGKSFTKAWGGVEKLRQSRRKGAAQLQEAGKLVHRFGERRVRRNARMHTIEHNLTRHMSRARDYLEAMRPMEITRHGASGRPHSDEGIRLLSEASAVFDDVVLMYNSHNMDKRVEIEDTLNQNVAAVMLVDND